MNTTAAPMSERLRLSAIRGIEMTEMGGGFVLEYAA